MCEPLVATDEELRRAITNAERRTGFTYDELAEQARTGQYASFQCRLAWVGIGGLPDVLDRSDPGATP